MTTENRTFSPVAPEEGHSSESLLQLVAQTRQHGELLLAQGVKPKVASVAVHAFILQHISDSAVHRRPDSPYDVTIWADGEKHIVFLDIECHRIIWDVLAYLVSDNQEK